MAMNIHHEARRRQMHMDRVCEARRRMALSQDETQAGASASGAMQTDPVTCTDQGQFYQTSSCLNSKSVHVWTGPERNRRTYDRSREGPILGQSWRALEREMNFRENSLSSRHYPAPTVGAGGIRPADAAFGCK